MADFNIVLNSFSEFNKYMRVKKVTKPTQSNPSIKKPNKHKIPVYKKIKIALYLFLIFFGISFVYQVFFAKETITPLQDITTLPVIKNVRNITGANKYMVKGQISDRINALILGQGGIGHDGPYLTDTIMIASYKPSTGQVAIISIPRDMQVISKEFGKMKINSINAYGEVREYPGGGSALIAKTIEDNFNIPIHYWVRIDFEAFKRVIDLLGGVEIDIEKSFTDYQYPAGENKYKTVSFEAGKQTLSGERALEYVRSRHSAEEEGDFSRARRQQKLLLALKDKVLSSESLLKINKILPIYNELKQNIQTNVQIWEIPNFIQLYKKKGISTITSKILDDSPTGPLYSTIDESGAYVLIPKISDYSEIQFIVKNIFTISDIKEEAPMLSIKNGTSRVGLAQSTAEILKTFEFKITSLSNAESKNYQKTVLYDFTGGEKEKSKKFLETILQTKSQKTLPNISKDEKTDFLIILGRDQITEK